MPTIKMRNIEKEKGVPLSTILIDAYNTHGSQRAVAKSLKVSPATISTWLARLNLKEKTIVVPQNNAPNPS